MKIKIKRGKATIKRRVETILNIKLKNYTKKMFKLIRLLAVAFVIIFGIALIKYRVAYKVKINDQEVGYVANKEEFEKLIAEQQGKAKDLFTDMNNETVIMNKQHLIQGYCTF